jgi:hypothetical protein
MLDEYEKHILINSRSTKIVGGYQSRRGVTFRYSNDAERFVALHESTTSRLSGIPFHLFPAMFREDGKVVIGRGQFETVCPENPSSMEGVMMYFQDAIPRLQKLKNPVVNTALTATDSTGQDIGE